MLKHDCQPRKSLTRFTSPRADTFNPGDTRTLLQLDNEISVVYDFLNSKILISSCYRASLDSSDVTSSRTIVDPRASRTPEKFSHKFQISSRSIAAMYPEDENERKTRRWFFIRIVAREVSCRMRTHVTRGSSVMSFPGHSYVYNVGRVQCSVVFDVNHVTRIRFYCWFQRNEKRKKEKAKKERRMFENRTTCSLCTENITKRFSNRAIFG